MYLKWFLIFCISKTIYDTWLKVFLRNFWKEYVFALVCVVCVCWRSVAPFQDFLPLPLTCLHMYLCKCVITIFCKPYHLHLALESIQSNCNCMVFHKGHMCVVIFSWAVAFVFFSVVFDFCRVCFFSVKHDGEKNKCDGPTENHDAHVSATHTICSFYWFATCAMILITAPQSSWFIHV